MAGGRSSRVICCGSAQSCHCRMQLAMISSSALNAGHRLAGSSHSLQAAGRHAAAAQAAAQQQQQQQSSSVGGGGGGDSDSPHHDRHVSSKQASRHHDTIIEDNEISVASTTAAAGTTQAHPQGAAGQAQYIRYSKGSRQSNFAGEKS